MRKPSVRGNPVNTSTCGTLRLTALPEKKDTYPQHHLPNDSPNPPPLGLFTTREPHITARREGCQYLIFRRRTAGPTLQIQKCRLRGPVEEQRHSSLIRCSVYLALAAHHAMTPIYLTLNSHPSIFPMTYQPATTPPRRLGLSHGV